VFDIHYFLKHQAPGLLLLVALVGLLVAVNQPARAQTMTTLYSFTGATDGNNPDGGLVRDAAGNLYGTTYWAGWDNGCCGTVFELIQKTGALKVLHTFTGYPDGQFPVGSLIRDGQGNLYGTTYGGGAYDSGMVFEISKKGVETVLYSFMGAPDGQYPTSGVVRDSKGNLYGTTSLGGAHLQGTVFQLTPDGTEKVLYSFAGNNDGATPFGGVVRDGAGNLYGSTWEGGAANSGTVFEVAPTGKETVLYSFLGGSDGAGPWGLVRDPKGNLYGTTESGGAHPSGTVFELTKATVKKAGVHTILANFDGANGSCPFTGLVRDAKGNLYGVTGYADANNSGTVFEVTPSGTLNVLYTFTGGADGYYPVATLILDSKGNLYGTAQNGGNSKCAAGCGVVFQITP
jgi:uncharacterized repeat protein (TIGR03803 family)